MKLTNLRMFTSFLRVEETTTTTTTTARKNKKREHCEAKCQVIFFGLISSPSLSCPVVVCNVFPPTYLPLSHCAIFLPNCLLLCYLKRIAFQASVQLFCLPCFLTLACPLQTLASLLEPLWTWLPALSACLQLNKQLRSASDHLWGHQGPSGSKE